MFDMTECEKQLQLLQNEKIIAVEKQLQLLKTIDLKINDLQINIDKLLCHKVPIPDKNKNLRYYNDEYSSGYNDFCSDDKSCKCDTCGDLYVIQCNGCNNCFYDAYS